MKIAFIGTGVMGQSMVMNLCRAHHELHVYNRTYEKAKFCEEYGAKAFTDLKTCLAGCELVITIVGYPSDVEEVYEVIFDTCVAKTIAIDMTTSSPSLAVQLAEMGRKKGIVVLDAPVSGGDRGAKEATLSIMVGGDEVTFEYCLPVLQAMGKNIVYMGESGAGQHTKMANQIAIAGAVAGVAEAIHYADAAKLKPELVLSAMSAGAAGSWQMSNNGPKMLIGDIEPGFYIKHFIKDLQLAEAESKEAEINLPVLCQVLKQYQKLSEMGLDEAGTQAIIEYYKNKVE